MVLYQLMIGMFTEPSKPTTGEYDPDLDSEITDIVEVSSKIKIEFSLFSDFYKDRNVIVEKTDLSTCLSNGCYGCNSSIIDTIPDKPDFITNGFVLFVNDPNYMHFSYQRYLENRFRSAFMLEGTPIKLVLRKREN